jgi:hypothetical protein
MSFLQMSCKDRLFYWDGKCKNPKKVFEKQSSCATFAKPA